MAHGDSLPEESTTKAERETERLRRALTAVAKSIALHFECDNPETRMGQLASEASAVFEAAGMVLEEGRYEFVDETITGPLSNLSLPSINDEFESSRDDFRKSSSRKKARAYASAARTAWTEGQIDTGDLNSVRDELNERGYGAAFEFAMTANAV